VRLLNQVQNRLDLVRTAPGREPFDLTIQNIDIVNVHSEEINKGNMGISFIRGFRILRGSIPLTVAHNHHNQNIAGMDDESMAVCARAAKDMKSGLVVALRNKVLAELPPHLVI